MGNSQNKRKGSILKGEDSEKSKTAHRSAKEEHPTAANMDPKTNENQQGEGGKAVPDSNSHITVSLHDTSGRGGLVIVMLYAHDKMLADAPATLAYTSEPVQVQSDNEGGATVEVVLKPSLLTIKQAGKSFNQMMKKSMYVTLDSEKADFTAEPAFNVNLGDHVKMEMKPVKSKTDAGPIKPEIFVCTVGQDLDELEGLKNEAK